MVNPISPPSEPPGIEKFPVTIPSSLHPPDSPGLPFPFTSTKIQKKSWAARILSNLLAASCAVESRGIARVSPSARHALTAPGHGYAQIALLWFSINLAANNITLGMLGPSVFGLSFRDACACAVGGMFVGSCAVAYAGTFGPRSGLRSMVWARYALGWWPAKVLVGLNVVVALGYAMIDAVVAGQIIAAVGSGVSVVVGIVVVSVVTGVVTGCGYQVFHWYERYAWVAQGVVFCILAGAAGGRFDTTGVSAGEPATSRGNRVSFFSLCLSAAITYTGGAADYLVYYPEETQGWKVFLAMMTGLSLSFSFAFVLGVGLGSGIVANADWAAAYETSQGALIVEGFAPLGGFGKFCGVVVALGLIANMIPPTYTAGVDFQILGRYALRVPRVVWNTFGVIVFMVCALAGRDHLAEIFTNFLALMGYWVSIWIAIALEEHLIFRRRTGFDWTAWNDLSRLPLGIAAFTAFLIGWAGAILCMAQVWYIGPIARLVGEYGADMGNFVGFAWAAIVFPPLRFLELKKCGR